MSRTPLCFAIILGLALLNLPAHAGVYYDGTIIDRIGKYDAYPTHLFIDGTHHLWWCSNSTQTADDGIFWSQKQTTLGPGGWSAPVEIFNHTDSPWAGHHVCDPSTLTGHFNYSGVPYSYVLYYTADDGSRPEGVNNSIGVAFSNNLTHWLPHSSPVISPDNGFIGNYGAGQSGIGFGPEISKLYHTYLDDTNGYRPRLKSSFNGITFSPTPSTNTYLSEAGRGGTGGREADIAFNPLDGKWYAVITSSDPWGNPIGEVRVLRSRALNTLTAHWDVIGVINRNLTGETLHHNPGLAKNKDGTLYVNGAGQGYVFIGSGPDFPDFLQWKVTQTRFDIPQFTSSPTEILVDVVSTQPLGLEVSTVGGSGHGSYSFLTAAVVIPGGPTANGDGLWNVQDNYLGKAGLGAFIAAGTEDAPPLTITISGLGAGAYTVFGRYATAPGQAAPNYYGMEAGLTSSTMTRYDQTTSTATVVTNWGNWQEWEVFLGTAMVSNGKITVLVNDDSVSKTAAWSGLRLVRF